VTRDGENGSSQPEFTDEHHAEILRAALAGVRAWLADPKRRKYANPFEAPSKQRKELGVVQLLLEEMARDGHEPFHKPRPHQPGGCPESC
jgi:hypothetical protein